jgi:hypothetical protein
MTWQMSVLAYQQASQRFSIYHVTFFGWGSRVKCRNKLQGRIYIKYSIIFVLK